VTASPATTTTADIITRCAHPTQRRAALLEKRPPLALDALADPVAAEPLAVLNDELDDIARQLAGLDDAEREARRWVDAARAEAEARDHQERLAEAKELSSNNHLKGT